RLAVTPVQRTSGDQADILTALAKLRAEPREAPILVDAIRISLREPGRICRQPPVRFRALLEGARADLARHLERQGSERPNQDNVSLNFLITVEYPVRFGLVPPAGEGLRRLSGFVRLRVNPTPRSAQHSANCSKLAQGQCEPKT